MSSRGGAGAGDHAAARFFDAIAGRYERVYALPARESRDRMERVVRSLPAPPADALVLGVGTGRELPALLDAGYAPTGLDVSRAMLERCARRARPVPLVEGDFWRAPLPFEAASFDAAIALHGTLAHPPDAQALAALGVELARVVRPGGRVVAEVPSPAWLDGLPPGGLTDADGRRARRTGPGSCVYEDLVAGVSIAAVLLDEAAWRSALGPGWRARAEPLGGVEWFVVAERV
jgi:SAM-dependent methyltransferase